jgi:hypothetical protein
MSVSGLVCARVVRCVCIYTYLLMHLSVGRQTHLPAARLARMQASARALSSAANCASILESLSSRLCTLTHTHMFTHTDTYVHLSIGGI